MVSGNFNIKYFNMDSKIIELLSDEIRETRNLTIAVREQTEKQIKELHTIAEAAMKKAEASWELVVITRNQVREEIAYLKKPIWKKWFGA